MFHMTTLIVPSNGGWRNLDVLASREMIVIVRSGVDIVMTTSAGMTDTATGMTAREMITIDEQTATVSASENGTENRGRRMNEERPR